MNPKTIYIPWFANLDDPIRKELFGDAVVIPHNIREIRPETIAAFIHKHGEDKAFSLLQKHYPDITKEFFARLQQHPAEFKGILRDVETTAHLTAQSIADTLQNHETIKLAAHSQGGLIAMITLMKHPELLDHIHHIDLLAPVPTYAVGKWFHGKRTASYISPKKVVVRKDFIESLNKEHHTLVEFLHFLNTTHYTWTITLTLGKNDNVVPLSHFALDQLQHTFPSLQIKIKEADHYLGYKKD